ncbi:MAG: hypothetical protein EOL97_11090 [Spirochaetia bacterium]|nr:hypothetical protein [Spirochaetia bacterium]
MKYKDLMEKIFEGYPRQIALPNRIEVKNWKELSNIITIWNNKVRIWISLYKYSFSNTSDFIIDKIWFDFDNNEWENLTILHNWLLEKKYKHFIVFSGKGFHCYILTNKKELKNNKIALMNAQNYIMQETKIEVDKQVIGDIARVVGLPGTFNCRRGRWIIFVSSKDLEQGEDYIKQKAESEQFGDFEMFGEKLFDMTEWDTGIAEYRAEISIVDDFDSKIKEDELLKAVPPCIANILLHLKDLENSYNERFIVIAYLLNELGYSEKMVEDTLKKFMTPKKFFHCIKEERQISHIAKRVFVPVGGSKIRSLGYCPTPNKRCENCMRL